MKGKVLGRVTKLLLTTEQHARLLACTTGQGGNQSLCQKIYDSARSIDGKLFAHVYEKDMERIAIAVTRSDRGTWQDLLREIMAANGKKS